MTRSHSKAAGPAATAVAIGSPNIFQILEEDEEDEAAAAALAFQQAAPVAAPSGASVVPTHTGAPLQVATEPGSRAPCRKA